MPQVFVYPLALACPLSCVLLMWPMDAGQGPFPFGRGW